MFYMFYKFKALMRYNLQAYSEKVNHKTQKPT